MGQGVIDRSVELGLTKCGMRAGKRWSERFDSLPRVMTATQITRQILGLQASRGCVQKCVLDTVEQYVGHAPSGQVHIESE
jgi:hypothetical protein